MQILVCTYLYSYMTSSVKKWLNYFIVNKKYSLVVGISKSQVEKTNIWKQTKLYRSVIVVNIVFSQQSVMYILDVAVALQKMPDSSQSQNVTSYINIMHRYNNPT